MASPASEDNTIDPEADLEASVDAVLALCDGDARAAMRSLVVANNYLEGEVERLVAMISKGYARGAAVKGRRAPSVRGIGGAIADE